MENKSNARCDFCMEEFTFDVDVLDWKPEPPDPDRDYNVWRAVLTCPHCNVGIELLKRD